MTRNPSFNGGFSVARAREGNAVESSLQCDAPSIRRAAICLHPWSNSYLTAPAVNEIKYLALHKMQCEKYSGSLVGANVRLTPAALFGAMREVFLQSCRR